MTSDLVSKEAGNISVVYNRVIWMLKFHDLEKNIRFKSPQFTLKNSTWQLRYSCFRSILNSKEWLDIGVKLLSKTSSFTRQKVRFGIAGNDLEIAKTLESDDIPKYYSLTLPYEDEIMYSWVPEGKLCLFFTIEDIKETDTPNTIPKDKAITDNEDFIEADQNYCADASVHTEEDRRKELTHQKHFVEVSTQTDEYSETWNLPEGFKEFLLQGNASDVILKVGEETFKSHKCILAARSPVFLDTVTQESKEKDIHIMVIPDIDPNIFSVFHNYLYTGNMEITSENADKLYSVANKYRIYELKNACINHMLKNISADNFCDVFSMSLLHEEHGLVNACSKFFMENSLSIVTTSKWETFLSENPVVGNKLYVKLLQMKK